ncbi:MAG: TIGR04282 family arsenosugar biosynthesis glycosyltransferase [Peptostreptococcus sp.]|uniref:TIGR04282 family arsenosugar biosynthesis glycosyltransferase n=1 Tax=Peptostreptococcus sp. TaxID=1262 RepID=UPI002FCB4E36
MKRGLIIFTRLPIAGKTKTRLEKKLAQVECASLHVNMLKDLNETAKSVDADVFISFTPNGDTSLISEIFTVENEMFSQKEDADIWERMFFAMKNVFDKGYDQVVLIGADIPEITPDHINKSFDKLKSNDLVITPTEDCGYCLIGSAFPNQKIFNLQAFTKGNIFSNTLNLALESGNTIHVNEKLLDLDESEDLHKLVSSEIYDKDSCKNTLKYLNSLGYQEKIDA